MRFFTRGWAQGELNDSEHEDVVRAYAAHLAALAPTFSEPLRALAAYDLHYADIEHVEWEPAQRRLRIQFINSSGPGAPLETALTYVGAVLGRQVRTLEDVARDRETQVLYHEVDRDRDGTFVHRILFWPRDELTIWFDKLLLEDRDRAVGRVFLRPYFSEITEENVED